MEQGPGARDPKLEGAWDAATPAAAIRHPEAGAAPEPAAVWAEDRGAGWAEAPARAGAAAAGFNPPIRPAVNNKCVKKMNFPEDDFLQGHRK